MGTFGGHVLPGCYFIVLAIWWFVHIFRSYFSAVRDARADNGKIFNYESHASYLADFWLCSRKKQSKKIHLEGIMKIVFCSIGLSLEIYTGFKDGTFTYIGNGQHSTMFFFFILSGIVDLLIEIKTPSFHLPPGIDYFALATAFSVEDILFAFHLHGRAPLDVIYHTLLTYLIHVCVITILMEAYFNKSPVLSLGKAFAILMQGTWFCQIAYSLYYPHPNDGVAWKPETEEKLHEQMMITPIKFCWHIAMNFFLMLIIGFLVRLIGVWMDRKLAKATIKNDNSYAELVGGASREIVENNNNAFVKDLNGKKKKAEVVGEVDLEYNSDNSETELI